MSQALTLSSPRRRFRRRWFASPVDLVILTTCLAMLAAVAVPRHLRFARDERREQVMALSRSVQSAASLAHAMWKADSRPQSLPAERGMLVMINGYPAPDSLPLLLEPAEVMTFRFDGTGWQHREVPAGRACGLSYQPPPEPGGIPTLRTLLAGC